MQSNKPDLTDVSPEVLAYIEALENELERLRQGKRSQTRSQSDEEDLDVMPEVEPGEPPTTTQLITATASGIAKRTPRHLYNRQRRGGMGIFDLEAPKDEPPTILSLADVSQSVLLITNLARAFRMPVSQIPEGEPRDRGSTLFTRSTLLEGETLCSILPVQAQGYVAMVSKTGGVRMLRHHVFGEHMKPGTQLYDIKNFGPLVSACWTPGDGDLFIATRQGRAIRFSEKLVPPSGGQGIRLTEDDEVVAVTAVYDNSGVFLLSADGKGTIREMEGFAANKAPGAGGKIALNTSQLVATLTVEEDDDIFIISRLGKLIRFPASQVPSKEGVVQGVICMSLRGDTTSAGAVSQIVKLF